MVVIAGAESHPATTAGGTYVAAPFRVVLHDTEGSSVDGAIGAYEGHTFWPHYTGDYRKSSRERGRLVEHYDFRKTSARALANDAGGVETNRHGAIQIELVGFADNPADQDLDLLARDFIVPVSKLVPITFTAPPFLGPEDGTLATETGKARMTFDQWINFNGICGHQHVPENEHWDPGNIDERALLLACYKYAAPPLPIPVPQEDEMAKMIRKPNTEADKTLLVVQPGNRQALSLEGATPTQIAAWKTHLDMDKDEKAEVVPAHIWRTYQVTNAPYQK